MKRKFQITLYSYPIRCHFCGRGTFMVGEPVTGLSWFSNFANFVAISSECGLQR